MPEVFAKEDKIRVKFRCNLINLPAYQLKNLITLRMFKILKNQRLNGQVFLMEVKAPEVAARRKPGQFVIVRADSRGERIPLTIVDADPEAGSITLVVQEAGAGTIKLGRKREGGFIRDLIGPLGRPSEIKNYGLTFCVAGGIGAAEILPVAKALREAGNRLVSIVGARDRDLLILEDEIRSVSDEIYITTDDGSYGRAGVVTEVLLELVNDGRVPDLVYAVGPVAMMRAVAELTRPYGIRTVVSLNPLMVDGTGMCGCCRLTAGGETKFACVDGPDFDAHRVDFTELALRQAAYLGDERAARERAEKDA